MNETLKKSVRILVLIVTRTIIKLNEKCGRGRDGFCAIVDETLNYFHKIEAPALCSSVIVNKKSMTGFKGSISPISQIFKAPKRSHFDVPT